ncbi:EthD family reductase [Brevundimonas diminuta]|uniref:EthD family reductase n=1 Tax=Brevundimonas diminuta TaxID=293 RepID=UPI003D9AA0A0
MISRLSFLIRRDDMGVAAFRTYWLEEHAPLVRAMPGLQAYRIGFLDPEAGGLTPDGADGADGPADGYAMMGFASLETMEAAFASPEGRAAAADTANFAKAVHRVVVDETVVI